MKRKHILSTILIGLVVVGCTQPTDNAVADVEIDISAPKTHFQQAMDNVLEIVEATNPDKFQQLSAIRYDFAPEYLTSDMVAIQAMDGVRRAPEQGTSGIDTLLYVVNFGEEQGFAIMSANKELLGDMVIAVADEGSISMSDFETKDEVSNGNDTVPPPPAEVIGGWIGSNIDNLVTLHEKDTPWTPNGNDLDEYYHSSTGEWKTIANIKPMVPFKIDQDYPYNKYCFTTDGQQALAGCSAIALVQVMAANKYPTYIGGKYINWDKLIALYQTDPIQENLLAHIIATIGKECQMNYGVNASGATTSNMAICLQNYAPYKNVFLHREPTLQDIRKMVYNELLPIPFSGFYKTEEGKIKGHSWTIDGWLQQKRTITHYKSLEVINVSSEERELIHCTFGWKGICDGYYHYGIFALNSGPVEREENEKQYPSNTNSKYDLYFQTITYQLH